MRAPLDDAGCSRAHSPYDRDRPTRTPYGRIVLIDPLREVRQAPIASWERPSRNPIRQEGYLGVQCSSAFAFALEAPRTFVIRCTPASPISSCASQTGTRRGGFA